MLYWQDMRNFVEQISKIWRFQK